MLKIKGQIAEKILAGVMSINSAAELSAEDIALMLEYPPDTTMGDLAFPCFKLSKALRRSPVQIAQTIAEGLSGGAIASAEAVNGYLNIKIDNAYLGACVLPEILEKKEDTGAAKALEMTIEELDLSVRAFNCLKRAGVNTVGDLVNKSPEEMMKVRNLGKKSLEEVIAKLQSLGFDLSREEE